MTPDGRLHDFTGNDLVPGARVGISVQTRLIRERADLCAPGGSEIRGAFVAAGVGGGRDGSTNPGRCRACRTFA